MDPLYKKFRIRPGYRLYLINPPLDFKKKMGELPEGVVLSATKNPHQIHWFVKTMEDIDARVDHVWDRLEEGMLVWIYFPKASSKMQTNLTRDKGWERLMRPELQFLNLVSFDETWSAFAFKKLKLPQTKSPSNQVEEFSEYINPQSKTVKIPDDLAAAFKNQDKLKQVFNDLAYSHKKEYVQWILSAKKEETRSNRVSKTLEMLAKGLKNPYDKN